MFKMPKYQYIDNIMPKVLDESLQDTKTLLDPILAFSLYCLKDFENPDGINSLHIVCSELLNNKYTTILGYPKLSEHNFRIQQIKHLKEYIGKQSVYGQTPLHLASDVHILDELIKYGASVNAKDYSGNSPLHYACFMPNANKETILKLIDNGADIKVMDIDNNTVLHALCRIGNIKTVSKLIDNGADVNAKNKFGHTPLFFAENAKVARILIEKIDENQRFEYINIKDNQGKTALFFAENAEVASILIDNDADVNAKNKLGHTPLFFAENADVASILIDNDADVNAKNKLGHTPLFFAENAEIARMLIEKIDENQRLEYINIKDNQGKTALFFAKNADVASILIDKGQGAVDAIDENHNAPLHFACNIGNKEVVLKLIEKFGNNDTFKYVNAKNKFGETPLFFAKNVGVASILIDNDADVSVQNKFGETPLHYASLIGDIKTVSKLIDNGADVNAKNKLGHTPLFFAKNVEVVSILIDKGQGAVDAIDENHNTPLHFGSINGETAGFEEREVMTWGRKQIKRTALSDFNNEEGLPPSKVLCTDEAICNEQSLSQDSVSLSLLENMMLSGLDEDKMMTLLGSDECTTTSVN